MTWEERTKKKVAVTFFLIYSVSLECMMTCFPLEKSDNKADHNSDLDLASLKQDLGGKKRPRERPK